jgi:hypothetical protein
MSQKINPIIFRLSNNNNWAYRYIEKKLTESALYNYNDIEIRKFITKFFAHYGLILQDLKMSYFNNTLNIFVVYFPSLRMPFLISERLKTKKIKLLTNKTNKQNKINKNYKRYKKITKHNKYKELVYSSNSFVLKSDIHKEKHSLKLRRITFLKLYKNYLNIKKYLYIHNIQNNFFLYKFFESLNLFTKKKFNNINLITKQINKGTKQEFTKKNIKVFKKDLIKLRKYDKNEFFKEGLNIMFQCSIKKNSAKLLSYFVALQLKKFKRHNFFLRFIKNVLVLLNNKTFSKIEGIKIQIKGRFNKAPRARSKTIQIGKDVPALTVKCNINYAETTSFTANGTFGVKVWIFEKEKRQCLLDQNKLNIKKQKKENSQNLNLNLKN